MVHSPVKFDDLAFILLFFFMMLAVISFSQNNQEIDISDHGSEEKNITLNLTSDERLSYQGKAVDDSFFTEYSDVSIVLDHDVLWSTAEECIQYLSDLGVTVTIVI